MFRSQGKAPTAVVHVIIMLQRLCSPSSAAKAVQLLKSQSISGNKLVSILEDLTLHLRGGELPGVTIKWCLNCLSTLSDPVVRHACTKLLQQMTDTNQLAEYVALSCLRTGDIELALSVVQPSAAPHQLQDKLAAMGQLSSDPTPSQWLSCFEFALWTDNYSLALHVWEYRSKFSEIPVTAPLLHQFIILVGRHQDKTTLSSILEGIDFDLPLTSSTISACFNCMIPNCDVTKFLNLIEENMSIISQCNISDLQNIGDFLAAKITEVINHLPRITTTLGNILLLGMYRNYTSHLAFHFYRRILKERQFVPNYETAQILGNAAYRLGNSKLLIYEIWREMNGMPLTRKFYETMLACQLVGTGYISSKFVLAEMKRKGIPIRQHIQIMVYKKFQKLGDSTSLLDLLLPGFESQYTDFDTSLALTESGNFHLQTQALANAKMFTEGKDPDIDPLTVLSGMLEYDSKRQIKRSEGAVL